VRDYLVPNLIQVHKQRLLCIVDVVARLLVEHEPNLLVLPPMLPLSSPRSAAGDTRVSSVM